MMTEKSMSATDEASLPKKRKISAKKLLHVNKNDTINKFKECAKTPYHKQEYGKSVQGALGGKPNWKEYKQEKKELRLKRRSCRNLSEFIIKAKPIWEMVRVKTISSEKRNKLINELHALLGNKGNYFKFVRTHDMARIVQYMLKYGSEEVRNDISSEIIPETVKMLQLKYAKVVVKYLLKYCNKEAKAKCIQACYGYAVKLASHGMSAPVFEFAYSEFATPTDKINLIQEFFGDMYKKMKDANVKHLRDVYKESESIKAAVLNATKANLSRILDKNLLDSGLVQSVIAQFLNECSCEDKTELISQLAPHTVVLSNSKDGAKAAMVCLWHGTNKDKRAAGKAIRDHVVQMCKHEHGHTVIICLLDVTDDTILLSKIVLYAVVQHCEELIADDWGRRVLSWIVAPGDRMLFHPQFLKELEDGRKTCNSKKDSDIRRREIIQHCIKPLLAKIAEQPDNWCKDAKALLTTTLILRNEYALEEAGAAFKSLATLVIDLNTKIESQLYVENSGIHMCLKKLIQNDAQIQGGHTFGGAIVDCLTDDVIIAWVQFNRGCFLLADIYSNNKQPIQECLKEMLIPHLDLIASQKTKGAQLLLQKLA